MIKGKMVFALANCKWNKIESKISPIMPRIAKNWSIKNKTYKRNRKKILGARYFGTLYKHANTKNIPFSEFLLWN